MEGRWGGRGVERRWEGESRMEVGRRWKAVGDEGIGEELGRWKGGGREVERRWKGGGNELEENKDEVRME